MHKVDYEKYSIENNKIIKYQNKSPYNKKQIRDLIDVYANIYCEKESHKGIIIGKKGTMLRAIGESARQDIEKLMGSKINLQLWVKVEKNWRDKDNKVKYFGYK